MDRISKNGELTERHLRVLRAIKKLQPCGSTSVARMTGGKVKSTEHMIYWTLYRRGLVESDVIRERGKMPRRKQGTLRLTPEGERAINPLSFSDSQ